jgi:hypothetical protein
MPLPPVHSGIRDNHSRGSVGEFFRRHLKPGADLDLVTAYFTVFAYDKSRQELNQLGKTRLLFGEAAFIKGVDPEHRMAPPMCSRTMGWRFLAVFSNGISPKRALHGCGIKSKCGQ